MMGTSRELSVAVGGKGPRGLKLRAGLWGIVALLCAVGTSVGCGGTTGESPCDGDACQPHEPTCLRNGTRYAEGMSAPAGDGCNSCTCQGGDWQCTLIGCGGSACVYGGQIHSDGSSFPSSDGCNECSCENGTVACTDRACPTVPASCTLPSGNSIPSGTSGPAGDGCNSCSCLDGRLACTEVGCAPRCYGDADCTESEYCAFPVNSCITYDSAAGASADAESELRAPSPGDGTLPPLTGTCSERPTVCTGGQAPVCGCDGQTYRNSCAAASLGLSLRSNGACP